MVKYSMYCPIHNHELITSKQVPGRDGVKKVPLFECKDCNVYYFYDPTGDGKKIGNYGSSVVMGTSKKYKVVPQLIPQQQPQKIIQATGEIFGDKPNQVAVNPLADITVRIKKTTDDEVKKAKNNLKNLRNEFPGIASEKMSVFDFIHKVCGNLNELQCVVRNMSLIWKGILVKKVEFYVTNAPWLKNKLPDGMYISFGGKITNAEFVIDEIRVLDNPLMTDGWMKQNLRFAYDGPKISNWFYNITKEPAEPSAHLKGELKSWNEYLEWKRQIAKMRIKGVKYVAVRFDFETRKAIFLAVTDGEKQFKEYKKLFVRNEISVFSNMYSKNRWYFEFNKEYKDAQDSGVDVIFMEFGRNYNGTNAVKSSEWSSYTDVARKDKDDKSKLSLNDKLQGLASNYFEPFFQEIIYELTDRAMGLIKHDIKSNGSISENVEKAIGEEFYSDGYLATTQIGDFALLSRLQKAIDDLSMGKCANQSLEQWLFDVKKANKPSEIEKITTWQNANINAKQKQAVEKIISNPDICLIQGPPGTGKTTVIAEAIYQLVIRNKRVLVASQANLAVDNALERLITNPKIRAIRLGNAKKIDDSVKNITEEYVLETFYKSIVDYVQTNFLNKWEEADQLKNLVEAEYACFERIKSEILDLENENTNAAAKIDAIRNEEDSEISVLKRNAVISDKISVSLIQDYCDRRVSKIDLVLSKNSIDAIWASIETPIYELNENGVCLTKVGVDTSSTMKVSQSNLVIKNILSNIHRIIELSEKVNNNKQFGGASEELEHAKLQEIDLREKMMSDPSVFVEWQKIVAQIKVLEQNSSVLSDSDLELFKGANDLSEHERIEYVVKKLEFTVPIINSMIDNLKIVLERIIEEIEAYLIAEEKNVENRQKTIEIMQSSISQNEQIIVQKKHEIQELLGKYNASENDFLEKLNEYKNQKEKDLGTSLGRNEWEEIFGGLRDWVDDIPDYSQEKDIFLKSFINGCNVVGVSCTENARTLNENGFDDFDVVIIDEVSKATPPELLIPMLRGRKVVLVGDHRQLPPLFNEHEKSFEEIIKQQKEQHDENDILLTMEDFLKYKEMVTASLFERHFETADPSVKETLTIQYRMHSDIMELINLFYDGKLRDGNEDEYTEDTKAHYLTINSTWGMEMITPEKHAYWFDSSILAGERIFEQRHPQSPSMYNTVEAESIIELLRKMENQYANIDKKSEPVSVGVISFYYDQVSLIKKMLQQEQFHAIDVEVNTVDRFQGKEKEIIFVSLVRNKIHPQHNLDAHIAAFQRINVAFSRAQNLLIIVGASEMYEDQPVKITDMNNGKEKIIYPYKQIIEIMNNNGTYFTCDEVIPEARVDEILMSIAMRGESE